MKVPFVDFPASYRLIKPEIDKAIFGCLERGDFILRDDVSEFEKRLADFLGVKYAVGVANGTDALTLTLRAYGIDNTTKVATSAYTFWATVEAIKNAGGQSHLVDITDDLIMDFSQIPLDAKVIIPVWIGGLARPEKIKEIAQRSNAIIIEDACQAIGAKDVGKYSNAACYSFYPAKILGCYGDGGAVATNDWRLAERVRLLRDHFRLSKTQIVGWGYNSRLDNIQAAVLNVKMNYLPEWISRRQEIAKLYDKGLEKIDKIRIPQSEVYQEYNLRVLENRDKLYDFLKENEIETLKGEYQFPIPQPRNAVMANIQILRLPVWPTLTNEQILFVCEKIKKFYVRKNI